MLGPVTTEQHGRPRQPRASRPARANLARFAWLSVATAVLTITLKLAAYRLTGSVGLLSDAAESVVNLAAALVAVLVLQVAARPADHDHHFGHTKAEYFSAATEGVMIFVAALFIVVTAVGRFLSPQPLENVGVGLVVTAVAAVLNAAVALVLVRAGRRYRSITLTADSRHLLADVWTSAGVIVGVLLVSVTGWQRLDPVVALLVGCNIIWTGWRLVNESVSGLMDRAMSPVNHQRLNAILDSMTTPEVHFHALRTREAGHQQFVSVHVLVPGAWTVQRGHDLLEHVETRLLTEFEHLEVTTHLEPMEDPRSYEPDGMGVRPYGRDQEASDAG